MEAFSALLAICAGNSPVPGEFPAQRPVTRSFDVFFDLRLNKRLSKQSWGWWFETLSHPLWRHSNDYHNKSICVLRNVFYAVHIETKAWSFWFFLNVLQGVVVHCLGGHGRTGTMLACYLVRFKNYPANKAIETIRRMRPGSVETKEQEEVIAQFAKSLK